MMITRSSRLLAALALAACPAAFAAADQPPAELSPSAWPERRVPAHHAPASHWAESPPQAYPSPASRFVPARFQAPATGDHAEPAAGGAPPQGLRPLPPSPAQEGDRTPNFARHAPPWTSVGTSLAVVLGLFMAVSWALRRGMPKSAGALPPAAVEVLGRAQLVGRQQVCLVRCGNKLVLLNVTASGVETLTEITEPAEVDRLLGLCQAPSAVDSPLRRFLSHFTSTRRTIDFHGRLHEPLDFGHLEPGDPYAT